MSGRDISVQKVLDGNAEDAGLDVKINGHYPWSERSVIPLAGIRNTPHTAAHRVYGCRKLQPVGT